MRLIIAWARFKIRVWHRLILYLPSEWAHCLFVWNTTWPVFRAVSCWLYRLARGQGLSAPYQIGALRLDNPVGIAAGIDKNAQCIEALDAMGFGFIEVGTVTPKPQLGNLKPRIKKLFSKQAIVNAMGFNNDGLNIVKQRIASLPVRLKQKLMVSISKNKDSTDWLLDIKMGMTLVWFDCGAICINLSSPNTPGLRALQEPEQIQKIGELYHALCPQLGSHHLYATTQLQARYPLLVCKLSPDLSPPELLACCDALVQANFGAVILTNTTQAHPYYVGQHKGGLSGEPLRSKANDVLRLAANRLQGDLPIIGVGGIMNVQDAQEKMRLGARAIQLCTGFIFKGPDLLWNILEVQNQIRYQ